jgi:hypothetical protein
MTPHTLSKELSKEMSRPFPPVWLALWALVLSLGWLLPNHYAPWIAFYFDAWISYGLAVAAVVVLLRSRKQVEVHRLTLVFASVLLVPFIHYWLGLLSFSGQAWLGSAYLMGLVVVLIVGAHWESVSPNQAIDGLFIAIGVAAIVSVGLQLYQWLGLSVGALDLWVVGLSGTRPFANFTQPNQLGTFLLWALLACAWGIVRGQIGLRVAVFMAMYLLFGVALTQSRTAFVAVFVLAGAVFLWRRLWPSKSVLWSVAGLAVFYLICASLIPMIARELDFDGGLSMAARSGGELRFPAYGLFLDAALHKPIWGYGWAQTAEAQLAVAENHLRLDGFFAQAHNLFLDLILWFGMPVGGLISLTLILWFIDKARRVASAQNAILVMFVGVVAWHAMLELPLHYAYMLFPTGLVMGVLNARLGEPVVTSLNRWTFAAIVMVAVALLTIIARDYLRIEEDFRVLRFERARIGAKPVEPPASVLILNQMDEFVRLGRTPATKNMTVGELDSMRKSAHSFPSQANLYTLATALALNQRTDEAQILVNKLARATTKVEVDKMQNNWQHNAQTDTQLQAVSWPD